MRKPRLGKKQWFNQALKVLENSGIEKVTIENLARQLGLSRNAFYWHFKTRQDLLDQLLEYWTNEFTYLVIKDEEIILLPAKERLRRIMEIVRSDKLARYDLAFSAWARIDPNVMEAVKKVTMMRHNYLEEIYKELGYCGDELEAKVRLFVCFNSWQAVMFDPLNNDSEEIQEQIYKIFL